MDHVLDFKLDGSIEAMHNDQFSLSFLGRQQISRASEIRFNEVMQDWMICLPDTEVPSIFIPQHGALGFRTYEGARRVEVAWFNACRIGGIDPRSEAGLNALKAIRSGSNPDL